MIQILDSHAPCTAMLDGCHAPCCRFTDEVANLSLATQRHCNPRCSCLVSLCKICNSLQRTSRTTVLLTNDSQLLLVMLTMLCLQVPPMAPDKVQQVIEKQLGKPPDEVFACIDLANPLASASMAQVRIAHAGTLFHMRCVTWLIALIIWSCLSHTLYTLLPTH